MGAMYVVFICVSIHFQAINHTEVRYCKGSFCIAKKIKLLTPTRAML